MASKLLKIFFFVIILLVIAAGGLFWYWKTHKKEIIRSRLEKTVSKESDGLYKLHIGDLYLDEKIGVLSLTQVNLQYDNQRFQFISRNKDAPPILINIKLKELKVSGIKSMAALRKSKIRGKLMEIKDPVIDLYYTYLGPGASENIPTREEIYRQMIGEMEIELDSIRITNAKIRTMSLKTGKPIMESEKVDISFKDVKMNKEGLADKSRYFFSRSFAFKARIIHWFSKNKLYKYDAKNLTIHSDSNDLHLQEFSINPLLDENGFAYALPFQDDRYDFTFSDLRVRNFDPGALLDENLRGDELMIRSAKLYIYRDLHRPRDEKNRVGHYPHQVINRTPFHFTLKRISLPEFYLEYKEKSALTGKTGRVQFYGASVSIANFTNDSASVAINNIMTADANSRFLNKTPLITHWTFYLMNPTGKFEVKGSAGPINGYDLNPLLEPMGPARIEKGHFSGLQFAFTGNNHTMNGTVQLLYEDLKVALLEKDPAKKKIKKVFSSFFANLLIKNDNPKKREAPRVAQVNSNRDPNRSFFSFCWRSVFKGMQQCAGISQ